MADTNDGNTEPDRMTEDRLATLWAETAPAIAAYLGGEIRDRHDAEDVLQDVGYAIVQGVDRFQQDRPFINWAFGIAHKQVLRYYQRRGRDRRVFSAPIVELLADAYRSVAPVNAGRQDALAECLERLPSRQARAVRLFYEEELDQAEIAVRLAMSRTAVGVLLHRTRIALRDCVQAKLRMRRD